MQFPSGTDETFHVGLDFSFTVPHWRVYHDSCAGDLLSADYDVDLAAVLRAVTGHSCPSVDPETALDFAIFAVSNHTDPDASTEVDVKRLEDNAPAVVRRLSAIRDLMVASGEDLPDYVTGDEDPIEREAGVRGIRVLKDAVLAAKTGVKRVALPKERPLSDFALHIGLLPLNDSAEDRAAGLWLGADNLTVQAFGKDHSDLPVPDMPGLYVAGTWTEWGEVSEDDPTTHLVYRLAASPWTDLSATVVGVLAYVKRHKGWGRLTDTFKISEDEDWAEQVATVTVCDGDAVVVPRDWRTRY